MESNELFPNREQIVEQRRALLESWLQTEKEEKVTEESQVSEPSAKKNWDVATPWTTLLREAAASTPPCLNHGQNGSLGDDLLDVALRKTVAGLTQRTGLSKNEVRGEVLQRLRLNLVSQRSAQSTVRFFRDAEISWFTDCPACGEENDPPWDICSFCGENR